MKLTYRGIIYKLPKTDVEPHQHHYSVASNKYCLNNPQAENQVILIRPIHYYTYRGVSYTKNLVFDTRNKLLLDINRQ